MNLVTFVALAVAGGVGSGCRFVLDGTIKERLGSDLPWATILINLLGSLLLGLLTGLAMGALVSPALQAVVGAGFLGGLTTFSTASVESVRLLQERRWRAAVMNVLGVLVAGSALAGIGLWLGSAV